MTQIRRFNVLMDLRRVELGTQAERLGQTNGLFLKYYECTPA